MAEFFFDYGLFALKALTIVVAVLIVVVGSIAAGMRSKKSPQGHIEVTKINEDLKDLQEALQQAVVDPDVHKIQSKQRHKAEKAERKANLKALKKAAKSDDKDKTEAERKQRLYVLDFHGDMKASGVSRLRREITAVLSLAESEDEVLVRLESGGGMVHAYGLASSQLQRVKDHGVSLTVCVDKVAASGGYMMACVASKLIAAPFAIIGSIGVIAQLPNFHRLLKKNEIDFEMITAGEYKRTLTMFGENTQEGRDKFKDDIQDIHTLFKDFVSQHRPQLNISEVSTGEIWFGQRAIDRSLVDELMTSDEYIVKACAESDVFEIKYEEKKSLPQKLGFALDTAIDSLLLKWFDRGTRKDFYS
ncbi:MAG: protease SohB [Gammaproteobacteria bacterium]|nr:protease SohB [Gammaproteobacteria bacterium]